MVDGQVPEEAERELSLDKTLPLEEALGESAAAESTLSQDLTSEDCKTENFFDWIIFNQIRGKRYGRYQLKRSNGYLA